MPRLRTALIAVTCTALSACAATPSPAPAPVPQAAEPPQTVDGLYIGTSTRFQADRRQCPHPGLVKLEVLNNQFQYRWDYRTYVDSSIDPQNEVHGQAENITLVGRLKGKRMEGDVTNGWCGLHFTVTRRNS